MKNKKNDGKYVIIDDGTAGGLFLSENEYYVDENKKVVLCNSEKKDNLFRKRYKLTHGDQYHQIFVPRGRIYLYKNYGNRGKR